MIESRLFIAWQHLQSGQKVTISLIAANGQLLGTYYLVLYRQEIADLSEITAMTKLRK